MMDTIKKSSLILSEIFTFESWDGGGTDRKETESR